MRTRSKRSTAHARSSLPVPRDLTTLTTPPTQRGKKSRQHGLPGPAERQRLIVWQFVQLVRSAPPFTYSTYASNMHNIACFCLPPPPTCSVTMSLADPLAYTRQGGYRWLLLDHTQCARFVRIPKQNSRLTARALFFQVSGSSQLHPAHAPPRKHTARES